MTTRIFWEDLEPGPISGLGSHRVSREEIVAFARQWDPQPFHLDESAGEASLFGGLVASGWHSACIAMRLLVDTFGSRLASLGSPGVDELRWLAPVRPGDELQLHAEILETRLSASRPGVGTARIRYRLANQDDVDVLSMVGVGMVARRPPGADAEPKTGNDA